MHEGRILLVHFALSEHTVVENTTFTGPVILVRLQG